MSRHNTAKNQYVLKNYNRYSTEFVSGSGKYLYDSEGKEYLDFLSGIAVTGFGHQHIAIKTAVKNQLNRVWHTSNLFEISLQENVAAGLCKYSGLDKVFFCNSGTEANEAAIKFARLWGNGRYEIIAAEGSFHGRTMGALSMTGQEKVRKGFAPLLPGFVHVPFNDIDAVSNAVTENTCAVFLEVIQGENGIIAADKDYIKELRNICNEKNLLLIFDEVQTGIGRTGKFFSYQDYDVLPDVISFAKGIANGLPLGGVICNEKVAASIKPGCHGSTFGGNQVSLASASAVLELMTPETVTGIEALGDYLMAKLNALDHPLIKAVRGKGLMVGIEIINTVEVKEIASLLLASGIVAGTAGNNTLRLLPPFIINVFDIGIFIDKLSGILNSLCETILIKEG